MTIPKKSRRRIQVNGRTYHWMVSRRADLVTLTVQDTKTKELRQRRVLETSPDRTTSFWPFDVKEFILARFPQPAR